MSIHTNLNRLMRERGWKPPHLQAALCDQGVEVSATAVLNWLSGKSRPRAEYFYAIATALDCSADELFAEPELAKHAS